MPNRVAKVEAMRKNVSTMPNPSETGQRAGIELPPPPAEAPELALPDLVFTPVAKSEKPVPLPGEGGVTAWNEYTIISPKEGKQLVIVDGEAIEQKDFAPIGSLEVTIDWSALGKRVAPRTNYFGTLTNPIVAVINQLPISKKAIDFLETQLEGGQSRTWTSLPTKDVGFTSAPLTLLDEGRYIILMDQGGDFISFATHSAQGQPLKPRNWKRYDLLDEITLTPAPTDLLAHLKRLQKNAAQETTEKTQRIQHLNPSYAAKLSAERLEIVRTGDYSVVFTDKVPGDKMVFVDPRNKAMIFYYSKSNPREIVKIDTSGDPKDWKSGSAALPEAFAKVALQNLQSDPTGNFFCYQDKNEFVVVDRENLKEVARHKGIRHALIDSQGRLRGFDEQGHFVIFETNLGELSQRVEQRRMQKLLQGVAMEDLFRREVRAGKGAAKPAEGFDHLQPVRAEYAARFADEVARVKTLEDLAAVKDGLGRLKVYLLQQNLSPDGVTYVTKTITEAVEAKEVELSSAEAGGTVDRVEAALQGALSMAVVSEAGADLDRIKSLVNFLDEATRTRLHRATAELSRLSAELFRREGDQVKGELKQLMDGVRAQLERMTSKQEFDEWQEFRFPQLKSRLGHLAKECPVEADEAYKAVIAARADLQSISDFHQHRFEQEYARVREQAAERMEALVGALGHDIVALIKRLRDKQFKTRQEAETYLSGSEAKRVLEQEMAALVVTNPDAAKDLERSLKVQVSNLLSEIERGAMTVVAETGQQMVAFGETLFPRWEARVAEKKERQAKLAFIDDPTSHGAGVTADKILGDVGLIITTTRGKKEQARVFEDEPDESSWRYGLYSYRGVDVPPSYVTASEYKAISKQYRDWMSGPLKKDYEAKRQELADLYKQRAKPGKRNEEDDRLWRETYLAKLNEYAQFCADNHILLFSRADQVAERPEADENGKGFVPEWQPHWVVDPETEKNLESMARIFRMQLDLKEGVLNLKGHAGTGKDVLIKMFCQRTNRPYFSTDCTKWTTEYELSEDVILESKDGATQTVQVPSAVLRGITTPGAVVYFNEVNGMPEQAQIFLHALWDEKRAITLKTSSGKVIKAHPTALLASSMNPNYPGTFEPQFATKSRMVSLQIGYPPLQRERTTDDANPNPPYNASEALRIAREVDSLSDFTYEPNMQHNEFVRVWDKQVNGLKVEAPKLNAVQEFDLNTIRALVQFADKLREHFMANFEKGAASRKALPVTQPLTARELRRCAYMLSQMKPGEKLKADADAVARDLIEKFFLSHIDSIEDRGKVKTAMATWRSQNRVAA